MAAVSGTVRDSSGAYAQRLVRVYRRDNGVIVGSVLSDDTTGAWSVTTADAAEHFVIVHDSTAIDIKAVAILHGNGANNGTTITDSSLGNKAFVAYGNACTSTTQSKFNGSSIKFDGTGDYIAAPSHADFGFGTGDYTIEAWVWLNDSASAAVLLDWRGVGTDGQYPLLYITGGALKLYINSGVRITASSSGDIASQTWTHVALCRASGTTKLFVGGVQKGSSYSDSGDYAQNIATFGISTYDHSDSAVNGYFADIRITKGYAWYPTGFTPPAAAHPDGLSGGASNAIIYDRLVPA